jgi:SAM-dependent methyltransferase
LIVVGYHRITYMAAQRGVIVHGLDATSPFIAIASERTPHSDFRVGGMEDLPFPNETFDVVTGLNAFQYAANPARALQEARRVAYAGVPIVVATWGKPQACDAAVYLAALGSLLPPPPPGTPGPFALSEDGALALGEQACLTPMHMEDAACVWNYPDLETALKGILSLGPTVRAVQVVGEKRVREVVTAAIAPYRQPSGAS